MSMTELIPLIDPLSNVEKFQLLQYLITELGKEAGAFPLDATITYPVWTPYGIPAETAEKLATMLAEEPQTISVNLSLESCVLRIPRCAHAREASASGDAQYTLSLHL